MTNTAFLALAVDEANETLLHASYQVSPAEYEATRFALTATMAGIRSRLGIPPQPRAADATIKKS